MIHPEHDALYVALTLLLSQQRIRNAEPICAGIMTFVGHVRSLRERMLKNFEYIAIPACKPKIFHVAYM